MIGLDATTLAAYAAAASAADKVQAVIDSLAGAESPNEVRVKIYNGASPNAVMASGTMVLPWATEDAGTLVVGEVSSFTVATGGTPGASWYLQFESGDRYVRGTFGLSGTEFTWSMPTFAAGQTGTIGTAVIGSVSNSAPTFTVAPTTATILSAGGTIQFTATDPDGDTLTYSLVSAPAGYSISSSTGLVTVASGAASQSITVRASDGSLWVDHPCAVTVSTVGTIKWFPGNYAQPNAHLTPTKYAQYTSEIAEVANVASNRIVGIGLLPTWGQCEATKGVYNWTKLREYRDQVVAQDKRVWLDWMFGTYGYSSPSTAYFPQWAINEGLVGYSSNGQHFLKFYRAAAMDRMIAFYQAMATEFDNDEWIAGIGTPETSHGIVAGDADCTAANALTQWKRFVDAVKVAFVRTPVTVQNNFLFNQSTSSTLTQYCIDNGMGLGGPDLILVPEEGSLSPDGWLPMYLKGWRYNGSTWVEGVAADQTDKISLNFGQQVIRSTAATPQKYHEEARDFYRATHVIWQIKYTAYLGYAYTTRVPAMDWANVETYLAASERTLRTALPTNLGGA